LRAMRDNRAALLLAGVAVAAALAARLAWPFDGLYGQDAFAYFRYARALWPWLLRGEPLPIYYWPAGYPLLVALVLPLLGGSSAAGQAISIASIAVAAGCTFLLSRELLPDAPGGRLAAWVAGLAVALCGLASGDTIYGTGYTQVKTALESGTPLPARFGGLKLLATTFAAISGIPGGIFSPSLAVGAGLGSNLAPLFHGVPLSALMLLGMVAYFAGVVQAPITAFVIVTEMTDNHSMVVPLMAAALIAYGTSRLICEEGIYHALAKGFVERAAAPKLAPPSAAS